MTSTPNEANVRRGLVVVAAIVALGLVAVETVRALLRPPAPAPAAGVPAFVIFGWSLGFLLMTAFLIVRHELRRSAARHVWGGVAAGGAEGFVIWLAVVYGAAPKTLTDPGLRSTALIVALAGGGLAGGLVERWRAQRWWIGPAFAGAVLAAAAAGLAMAAWNAYAWEQAVLHAVVAAAAATLLAPKLGRVPARAVWIALTVAVAGVVAGDPLVAASRSARELLHARSTWVRAWARGVIDPWADRDRDGASTRLGGHDCDPSRADVYPGAHEEFGDGIDANCGGGDGSARRQPTAMAPGAPAPRAAGSDVILISIDSVRWDLAGTLRETRTALGPHVWFRRAVVPYPQTRYSLASTVRGLPYRGLRLAPRRRRPDLWPDASPTVGHILARAGYRSVTVQTHAYDDKRPAMAAGFETVYGQGWDAREARLRAPLRSDRLSAGTALAVALTAARETDRPICLWVHLMETHHPYWHGSRAGPTSVAGLRESIRFVDRAVARFLRAVRRSSSRPPIVAIFGDHGEEMGEHGSDLHGRSVHAEQARVAFFLAGPGIRGGRYDGPVSTASLPATILDALGLAAPPTMTEPSLLPALSGRGPVPELAVTEVINLWWHVTGYTGARYRLVRNPIEDVEWLFDADEDPYEQHDLSRDRPQALAEMQRLADAWDEGH